MVDIEKPEWVTIAQIANHFDVDTVTVGRQIHAGLIPYVKIGRMYRIPKAWLATRKPCYAYEGGIAPPTERVHQDFGNHIRGEE